MWICMLILALGFSAALSGRGETVELKGGASVTGPILVESKEWVVVDLGYTLLSIPRAEVVRRLAAPEEASAKPTEAEPSVGRIGLYHRMGGVPPDQSVRELVARLGEAVVQIRTPAGLGSGFFLNEEGYLITNFHVIEGESEITIEVYHQENGSLDRRIYKDVRIVAMDKFDDLALLKVEDKAAPEFRWVPLGSTDALAVGEPVFAIGSPLGLERTVTEGIVSTKTREYQGDLYLQTTAQINPGNSGGPLFNLRGEVVGVTNMKVQFGEGIGFAIPVDEVKFFLKHRDAYAYDKDNPTNPYRYLEPPRRVRADTGGLELEDQRDEP